MDLSKNNFIFRIMVVSFISTVIFINEMSDLIQKMNSSKLIFYSTFILFVGFTILGFIHKLRRN
jgi:hypothetical protein